MALVTLGTVSSTSFQALQIVAGSNSAADLATLRNNITNDAVQPSGNARPIYPGALENSTLFVPNRGRLTLLPGDWVGVDSTTGAILLVPGTILPTLLTTTAATSSGSTIVTGLATGAGTMGLVAGMAIASTAAFSSGTIIQQIVPGGSSIILNFPAAISSAAATLTFGGPFTHG